MAGGGHVHEAGGVWRGGSDNDGGDRGEVKTHSCECACWSQNQLQYNNNRVEQIFTQCMPPKIIQTRTRDQNKNR